MRRGVDWGSLRARAEALNLKPLCEGWEAQLRALAKEDLVIWEGDHVRLGARGMLMSNGILQMFV
jgi:hypothetical protein